MWRVLIVEDSSAAAERLRGHLERFGAEHGEAFSVQVLGSAVEFLSGRHPADLVFLDIDLPGLSGMEAAELWRLTDESTPMIFVTNMAQFAIEGYRVQALDFVVKPVSYRDFEPRMARALTIMRRTARATISVTADDEVYVIDQRDIVYVEVRQHNLYWHLAPAAGGAAGAAGAAGAGGAAPEPLRSRGTMRELAEQLPAEQFCRISASFLINMGQVVRLRAGSVVMSDGTELALSRTYKKAATEALARYVGKGA